MAHNIGLHVRFFKAKCTRTCSYLRRHCLIEQLLVYFHTRISTSSNSVRYSHTFVHDMPSNIIQSFD